MRPLAPRNRCGALRTSPDGPRAESCFLFADGSSPVSNRRRQCDTEKLDSLLPLTGRTRRAQVSRSRTRNPAQIGSPKDSVIQWLRSAPLQASDWTKAGVCKVNWPKAKRRWPGPGSPQRLLVTFVRTKVTRGAGPGRPQFLSRPPGGRPISPPGAEPPLKNGGAPQRSSVHLLRTAFSCCWFSSLRRWLTAIFRMMFLMVTSRSVPSR